MGALRSTLEACTSSELFSLLWLQKKTQWQSAHSRCYSKLEKIFMRSLRPLTCSKCFLFSRPCGLSLRICTFQDQLMNDASVKCPTDLGINTIHLNSNKAVTTSDLMLLPPASREHTGKLTLVNAR